MARAAARWWLTHRLLAGSVRSWWRWSASADGRAYLASEAIDVWPDLAISITVLVPSSASWVSALELGVPASAIITEPAATNTGENITRSRDALRQAGIHPAPVLLISLPYMERRAYAASRRAWPEVEAICASEPLTFDEYVTEIGDAKLLIDILVGDFQRVIEYSAFGYAIAQEACGFPIDASSPTGS
jgi:hypothetical protein